MTLEFTSRAFSFERATVHLFGPDWEEAALSRQEIPVALHAEQNSIEGVSIERPGQFQLILAELSVKRRSDGRAFSVPILFALVTISDHDIANGKAVIPIEPDGIYQITLFDSREHRPLKRRRLTLFANTSTSAFGTTFGIDTDDTGTITFLGNPTAYRIQIDGDVGLTIVPI